MAQYINKDDLVKKIKKRLLPTVVPQGVSYDDWEYGADNERLNILALIDELEVKEVDLGKEYKDFVEEDPVYNKLVNIIVGKAIAKHFFELGLKVQKVESD